MRKKNDDNQEFENSARSAMITGEAPAEDEGGSYKERLSRDISELHFRKTMHGYNMDDVAEYIDEQNKTFGSACQMYDGKIAELRAEVAFLNRERESLLKKLSDCRTELEEARREAEELRANPAQQPEIVIDEVTAEPAAEIPVTMQPVEPVSVPTSLQMPQDSSRLDDDYKQLVEEVASLRREKVETQTTLAQLAEIAADYEELSRVRDELVEDRKELAAQIIEKDDEIARLLTVERELNVEKDKAVELQRVCDSEQKKRAEAETELSDRNAQVSRASDEIDRLRKEISEFEIRQSVLRQQLKKTDGEIAEMREQNKKQAYEYANKANELEADFNSSKLKIQKQIQVHMYHIKQVDLLINELQKQFDDARSSLEVLEQEKKED